tara:strand:+ start:25830 stop:25979 length:150 start_codon:yes stop_codon:yes gene_type:complete
VKLKLPKKKLFKDALKMNRWPVHWFDQKKDKEKERKERIAKLYPQKKTP